MNSNQVLIPSIARYLCSVCLDAVTDATAIGSQCACLMSSTAMFTSALIRTNADVLAGIASCSISSPRWTDAWVFPSSFIAVVTETMLPLSERVIAVCRAADGVASLQRALPLLSAAASWHALATPYRSTQAFALPGCRVPCERILADTGAVLAGRVLSATGPATVTCDRCTGLTIASVPILALTLVHRFEEGREHRRALGVGVTAVTCWEAAVLTDRVDGTDVRAVDVGSDECDPCMSISTLSRVAATLEWTLAGSLDRCDERRTLLDRCIARERQEWKPSRLCCAVASWEDERFADDLSRDGTAAESEELDRCWVLDVVDERDVICRAVAEHVECRVPEPLHIVVVAASGRVILDLDVDDVVHSHGIGREPCDRGVIEHRSELHWVGLAEEREDDNDLIVFESEVVAGSEVAYILDCVSDISRGARLVCELELRV